MLAIGWAILIRWPLILNAESHLDSDLAVDGLTLLEAVQGHWRWHYPGTPYTGTGAVLLSWPQARIWGVGPTTLVSGGTFAYALLMIGTFFMTMRVFGPLAAGLSLVPLTFASSGTLWLSGRITGGHLLAAAWSALTWLLADSALKRGGRLQTALLGFWCGLGLYHDSLFVLTLGGLLAAWLVALAGVDDRRARVGLVTSAFLVAGALLFGAAPRAIGAWLEPHDAYKEQFASSLDPEMLSEHGRILALECLPRLIAGHRLPGFESDPDPSLLGTGGPVRRSSPRIREVGWNVPVQTVMVLATFMASFLGLAGRIVRPGSVNERAIAAGLLVSTLASLGGFLMNRNIFNSDNYRYLVLLLIPWATGFGIVFAAVARRFLGGRLIVAAAILVFAALFTIDVAAWYRRMGWIDGQWLPVRQRLEDPALRWLDSNPNVRSLQGGYWDVYRLSFLTGGRVRGVPFPIFPDRFPEWSAALPGGRPDAILVRPSPEGQHFLDAAQRQGARVRVRERGMTILSWPGSPVEPLP